MKKRLNLIIGKKHIVIAGLTLILGIAVYVNYLYLSAPSDITSEEASAGSDKSAEAASYGEAQFVSTDSPLIENRESAAEGENIAEEAAANPPSEAVDTENADAYFAEARLDKAESRDEARAILESMYYGGDSTDGDLAVIAQSAAEMSSYIESESEIENLLKAQGFSDALCYLSESGANIIVKTSGLDAASAAVIKNTLLSEVSVPAENITIVEIN